MLNKIWSAIKRMFTSKVAKPEHPVDPPTLEAPPEKPPIIIAPPVVPATPPVDNTNDGNPSRPDWSYLWGNCTIDESRRLEVARVCKTILDNKLKYVAVEMMTSVPWYLVAALHYREASLDFHTCLHNGDPLPGPTRHVPKGRGPFSSWEAAAVDALRYDGLDRLKLADPVACLILSQKFNGMGYQSRGREYSPYVWAGTNWSDETGKYVADGKFSETAVEKQLGVAAIMKHLLSTL